MRQEEVLPVMRQEGGAKLEVPAWDMPCRAEGREKPQARQWQKEASREDDTV